MAFISLLLLWIFLFMAVVGLVLLLISLLLFLVNRHRKKKGKEKKRLYKIAGILCMVFGFFNLAPLVVLFVFATVSENVANSIDSMKVALMPEHAILFALPSDEKEKSDDMDEKEESGEESEEDDGEESEEEWDEDEEQNMVLLYKNKEYVPVSYSVAPVEIAPVDGKLEVSKPKAYLQYADSQEGETYIEDEMVLEVKSNTGFDLLCTGVFDFGLVLSRVYCRKEQCEEFWKSCQSDAQYFLQRDTGGDDDFELSTVSGDDFTLDSLGITAEIFDSMDDGPGETLGDYPKDEYYLSAYYMDGMFTGNCAYIGKYEGRWFCYDNYTYGEILNAQLLPDEGQRYMNSL